LNLFKQSLYQPTNALNKIQFMILAPGCLPQGIL